MPFELGRPFGAPNEPEFQKKVLLSLLSLFERLDGPVILEDFYEDPPAGHSYEQLGSCPVKFSRPVAESDDEALRLILAEVEMLRPWYNLSLEERGRTTFGLLGLEITQLIKFLTEFLVGTPKNPREDLTVGEVFVLPVRI